MSRLIDADKLKEAINSSLNTGRETFSPEIICEAVDEQPTAFDVDKVVEQLDTYITKLVGRNSALYQTVMQIVKGGGTE
jgi:hypothetical protein|nr:MAG TPA: hypothetical protein [Caudoviricetes sp.]